MSSLGDFPTGAVTDYNHSIPSGLLRIKKAACVAAFLIQSMMYHDMNVALLARNSHLFLFKQMLRFGSGERLRQSHRADN